MTSLRITTIALLAAVGMLSPARAEFVLDNFQVASDVTTGPVDLGNGFTRELTRESNNRFHLGGGSIIAFRVRSGTSVFADYLSTGGSLDIRGINLLRLGMSLAATEPDPATWTVSVALTDSLSNTETVSRTFNNPSGPFGIKLGSISESIRSDITRVFITWSFLSNGGSTVFGTGSGTGGFTFTPEPGSLILFSSASAVGLLVLRRRRKQGPETVEA